MKTNLRVISARRRYRVVGRRRERREVPRGGRVRLRGDGVLARLLADILGRMLQARVVRPTESVAAVEEAILGEGIVAAPELARHLGMARGV